MRSVIQITLLLLISFISLPILAEQSQDELVKQTVATFMKDNDIPGVAVEIYKNGEPASYYFGYANREQQKEISQDTIFEIGSLSKVMTSLLLAGQVDLARISLSDSVRKYLNTLPSKFNKIKLQDLATHTSGLPFDVPKAVNSREALETYLTKNLRSVAPNQAWIYSNLGVGLLSYALEAITQKDFEELYTTKILTPLGMKPIALNIPTKWKTLVAQGYNQDGKPVPPCALGIFPAAYGIKVSAEDMQRFLHAAIGLPGTPERVLYPMRLTQSAYLKLSNRMQGLAWTITPIRPNRLSALMHDQVNLLQPSSIKEVNDKPFYASDVLIDKTGGTSGFKAYIAVLPKSKSGIVILTNKSLNNNDIVNLGRKILFELAHPPASTERPKTDNT